MSEKGAIQKSTAQAICDAVKVKEGTTEGVPFKDVAGRILALPTSSGEDQFNQYFTKTLTEVTAEDLQGVKKLNTSAFEDQYRLTSVALPNTLTTINNYAFRGCSKLANITIPNSVTSIGQGVFTTCTSLTSVTLPDGISKIQTSTFSSCTNLASVTIPNSVTSMDSSCFSSCEKLTRVYYDGDIASWCNISFATPTSNPTYYAYTIHIKNANGDYEKVINLVIPNTVTQLKQYAFTGAKYIKSAIVPDSVTSIANYALGIGDVTPDATVTFLSTTPPSITSYAIGSGVAKIIVPLGCGDVYKSATNWAKFADCIEEATE